MSCGGYLRRGSFFLRKHALAIEVSAQHASPFYFVVATAQEVPVDDDEIGLFALLQRTDPVFQEQEMGVVPGVELDRLRAGEGFFGVKLSLIALGASG